MKIVVRADASLTMGSGHIMRCLTLADRLKQQGHDISFICRAHDGHLADLIGQKGFAVQLLAKSNTADFIKQHAHSEWLGASESDDFAECQPILQALKPDWLIIDHYAIGKNWEQQAKRLLPNLKILAIDDLADRTHDCEILLDQNFGRKNEDYQPLVPSDCQRLLGTRYTLLRDEFASWRTMSLNRRKSVQPPNNILVNLGGVDNDNVTLKILQSLNTFVQQSTQSFNVTVVMGKTAPHIESVQRFAKHASFACAVLVNVTNMAELMANADLAIGAAGSTTWERCCLGLPMVLIVLADQLGKSVGDMYLGAVGPSFIQVALFAGYVLLLTYIRPQDVPALPLEARTLHGWALIWRCIRGMVPSLILIFLVLGTIFLGIATPTEGGAMGAVGAMILAAMHRRLSWSLIREAMAKQGKSLIRITPTRWGPVATGGFPPEQA